MKNRVPPFSLKEFQFEKRLVPAESHAEFRRKSTFADDPDLIERAHREIKKFFVDMPSAGYREEDLLLTLMPREEGVSFHFLLADTQSGKKFHIKTSADSASSCGTRYNEVLIYKILERYGCGPKDLSAIIDYFGDDFFQDSLYDRNMALMIITEDLSNPDPRYPNRHISFEPRNKVLPVRQDTLYNQPPRDVNENVERCCIALLVSLLGLCDVANNYGNIGLQTIQEGFNVIRKPYIIDFKTKTGKSEEVEGIADAFLQREGVIAPLDLTLKIFDQEYIDARYLNGSCFVFELNQYTREKAFERIFGQDGRKFEEIIQQAADAALDSGQLIDNGGLDNILQLSNHCELLKERLSEFYNRCHARLFSDNQKEQCDEASDNMSLEDQEDVRSATTTSPQNATSSGPLLGDYKGIT